MDAGFGGNMADVPQFTERDVVEAINRLNNSTAGLAKVNIALTGVILILTAVQVWSLLAN